MSLFDRITPASSGAPTASNVFGAPKSSSDNLFKNAAPGQSLFGASSGGQNGSTPFGGIKTSQPPTSTSNLFGATATTQTSQPPASSSVFGSNSTSQGNASLFPTAGYLARDDEQQPQQQQSQFGNAPVDTGPTTSQPAYFDALLQRGRKRQTEEKTNPFGDIPQLQLGLQDISRKVRNVGQGGPSAGLARGADARAHYLLSASGVNTSEALRDLNDLAGGVDAKQQAAHDQPDLVYTSGVKETLAQRHQNDFQKMVDSHIQKARDDFDKMINERLHGVDWNAQRQRIYEHFGLKKPQDSDESTSEGASQPNASFGRSSRRGRQGASTLNKSFGLPGMTKSVIGTPGPRGMRSSAFGDIAEKLPVDGMRSAPEDRTLREKQGKYADRVKELNVARLQEKCYPILKKFGEVEAEPSNDDTSMLVHAYKALVKMTGEQFSEENASDPGAVKEREFAKFYLDEGKYPQMSTRFRERIISGSRTFLEELFKSQLEATLLRNQTVANTGGIPTAIFKVKGYVRVRASRKELGPDAELLQEVDGDYCWPVIFYLLRMGDAQSALQYVDDNSAAFRQIDRSFMRYLRAYITDDRKLPPDMQTSIQNEYSQRSRLAPEDSIDPYRMMCYKVIGRCELQKRTLDHISNDMMDWVWLQFALAREYSRTDDFAHEAFGLEELRQSIKEIGDRFFGPGSEIANAHHTLFFLQVLAGMYEKAVADLYPHNYVSATHFAIALDYYGALRVSDVSNSDDLLSYTTRQEAQIAFGPLLGLYTRDFRTAYATAAVDYLALICLNGDLPGDLGKRQRELCHQALTEVVLETREFAQLLGDIRSDGVRIKGAIEQRLKLIGLDNEQEFLKHITLVAARTAEEQSRVTDAALLFHLAEDYDKVIQVVNEAVSLALTTELGQQAARLTPLKPRTDPQPQDQPQGSLSLTAVDDPIGLARDMAGLYNSSQMYYSKIKEGNRASCDILLKLAKARKELEQSRWAQTIDSITSSRLLPTEASGDLSAIRSYASSFNSQLPPVVSRTIGHVMLWTILACSRNVEKLRDQDFETGAQRETIARCVQTSKDVMVFAGLIRFKLPGRVWERLAVMGGELGAY